MREARTTAAAVRVALLCSTRDDIDELREVLREVDAEIVFEADTLQCSPEAIRAAAPAVVLINLPASSDEHSPLLDELAESPELRVIFNDASITSALSGWDRARWRRHLSAKLLGREGDLPPRPEAAPSLRLPRTRSEPITESGRRRQPTLESEQLAAEMRSGLSHLADADVVGPPPRHDWASDLAAAGTPDVPLDSLATDGVAQQAMGTDMESTSAIEMDSEALGLNDAERELLGNLQAFDPGDESEIVPPQTQTSGYDEQRVDRSLDESAYPGTQVGDFSANSLDPALGAADEDLRLYEEITSDEAVPSRLDAPPGFAGLRLAPLDAEYTPARIGEAVAPAARVVESSSQFVELSLESQDAAFTPIEGRASFEIDMVERHVADLTSASNRTLQAGKQPTVVPAVWILLGGNGSDIGMLELLGELPPTLAVAFIVVRTGAAASAAEALPLDAWPVDTALAPGQAVSLDPTRVVRFDEAGRLLQPPALATHASVDAALEALAALYRNRLGLMLFEGQAEDGCAGIEAVVENGGTVWSAAAPDGAELVWNAHAVTLGALAQRGSALDLAQRLTGTTS